MTTVEFNSAGGRLNREFETLAAELVQALFAVRGRQNGGWPPAGAFQRLAAFKKKQRERSV